MGNSLLRQPRKNGVALVRWSTMPGDSPVTRFVVLSMFGLVLCLFLMIFLSGLRSFGAVALFMIVFPALFTASAVSSQRKFMHGLTRKVNDTVAEVTNTPGNQLTVKEFQRMVKHKEQRPLLVSGVPGLSLHVEPIATVKKDAPQKWVAVVTVDPPDNGTDSFDRLVAAAIGTGSGKTENSGS